MKNNFAYLMCLILGLGILNSSTAQVGDSKADGGWISLFNGKNLDGWKVGENAHTFSVDNGAIKVAGPKAHLFYVGDVEDHNFDNFEFKATVMTKPGSNSGIYIHTRYQEASWPCMVMRCK